MVASRSTGSDLPAHFYPIQKEKATTSIWCQEKNDVFYNYTPSGQSNSGKSPCMQITLLTAAGHFHARINTSEKERKNHISFSAGNHSVLFFKIK